MLCCRSNHADFNVLAERLEISTLNSSKDTTLKENAIDIMKTTIASF